jgi:uncharacterized protein (TIGR02452 family)
MSLKGVAQEVLSLLEAGCYASESGASVHIGELQTLAEQNTRLYEPGDFPTTLADLGPTASKARITVEPATTNQAAQALFRESGDVTLLNFASARNPGGGFLKGAKAQEEDLCRCSGLYPCLLTQPDYYQRNRQCESLIYTDHLIYSPRVPFFKDRGRGPYLDEPYLCNVITGPAPNAAELRKNPSATPLLVEGFLRRWAMVLWVAQEQGHQNLVLGAWGCGAFGNEAVHSAEAVFKCLHSSRFAESFREVIFAIPDRGKRSSHNLEVFRKILHSPS